jgi:hypothetical protein
VGGPPTSVLGEEQNLCRTSDLHRFFRNGEKINACEILMGIPEGNRPLEKPRRRREGGNISSSKRNSFHGVSRRCPVLSFLRLTF